MIIWSPQYIYVGLFLAISLTLMFFFMGFSKENINITRRKANSDKALLKELLEGFGLEIPHELKNITK